MFEASRRRSLAILTSCVAACAMLGACATGADSATRYENFLVVGLADIYENQVQYEQAVANRDEDSLQRILDETVHSSVGGDALMMLRPLALEQ